MLAKSLNNFLKKNWGKPHNSNCGKHMFCFSLTGCVKTIGKVLLLSPLHTSVPPSEVSYLDSYPTHMEGLIISKFVNDEYPSSISYF